MKERVSSRSGAVIVDGSPGKVDVAEVSGGGGGRICEETMFVRRVDQSRRGHRDHEHQSQSRQQPASSTAVEAKKTDGTGALDLLGEKPADQISGQDKEDIDTDKSAAKARNASVIRHNQQDRDRAKAFNVTSKRKADG